MTSAHCPRRGASPASSPRRTRRPRMTRRPRSRRSSARAQTCTRRAFTVAADALSGRGAFLVQSCLPRRVFDSADIFVLHALRHSCCERGARAFADTPPCTPQPMARTPPPSRYIATSCRIRRVACCAIGTTSSCASGGRGCAGVCEVKEAEVEVVRWWWVGRVSEVRSSRQLRRRVDGVSSK
ncbi:hypothetical protein DFH09DRAFT_1171714 [Mycena vulgaris]|nr:hypothetical protein DFH09DRAFT_1171714 [Mycena vulgaris]